MAYFTNPINSKAIVVYTPQIDPIAQLIDQIKTFIDKARNSCMESSFKAQKPKSGIFLPVPIREFILAGAYPRPMVGPGLPTPFAGTRDELLLLIQNTVHETIDHLDYNGLHPFLKMASQVEAGVSIEELTIDSQNEEYGTTCAGASHVLLKQLKVSHGIEGMFAAQRKQGPHAFGHAAVIIECSDGYVLLESRSDPKSRIFSIPFEQTIRHGNTSFTAAKPGSTIPILAKDSKESLEYCTNIANGDDLVMKHFMMEAPFLPSNNPTLKPPAFPIAAYYPNGSASKTVWVSLLGSRLTFNNANVSRGKEGREFSISFQEIRDGHLHSRLKQLYEIGEPTFHIPLEMLHEQLFKFVASAETIKQIFQEVSIISNIKAPITKWKDRSIGSFK